MPGARLPLRLLGLKQQFLKNRGWDLSVINKSSINSQGKEIPWFTYCSINFLQNKIKPHHTIFEYGSGNSTIWLSDRAQGVTSIDHDEEWYVNFKETLDKLNNVDYHFKKLDSGDYQKEILNYHKKFDIIIIDGRKRVECCLNALDALKDDGVIIWDNSERKRYQQGFNFLTSKGFKRLDFCGMAPIITFGVCTTIFYREDNCFSI